LIIFLENQEGQELEIEFYLLLQNTPKLLTQFIGSVYIYLLTTGSLMTWTEFWAVRRLIISIYSMLHNPDCHQLLAIVASEHHQCVHQPFHNGALSLPEPLCRVPSGRKRYISSMLGCITPNIILQTCQIKIQKKAIIYIYIYITCWADSPSHTCVYILELAHANVQRSICWTASHQRSEAPFCMHHNPDEEQVPFPAICSHDDGWLEFREENREKVDWWVQEPWYYRA